MRYDQTGRLRVVARSLRFEEVVRGALDQIRIYGASNPDIMVSLLDTLAGFSSDLRRAPDREVLQYHVKLIGADAAQIKNEADRERVAKHLQKALQALTSFLDTRTQQRPIDRIAGQKTGEHGDHVGDLDVCFLCGVPRDTALVLV